MTRNLDSDRPVVLCILDGWGYRKDAADNAIAQARTPVYDRLMAECPHSLLDASGLNVGLPADQMGNSEVGHMTIGAGRVVMQDLPRIDAAIADGSLAGRPAFARFTEALKRSGGKAHLWGLVSPGGVHSHQAHIAALANALQSAGVPVVVHAVLDGRDTPPSSGAGFLEDFRRQAPDTPIGTVCGRYYAMDRDKRWERVSTAYDALVAGEAAHHAADATAAVRTAYERGKTDEFVAATIVDGYAGMADGDGVLFANFRADRTREIAAALLDPEFDGFERRRIVRFAAALGMVEYAKPLNRFHDVLFEPVDLRNTLGAVAAAHGVRQLRIAETEKYAHVTFFLNGGEEAEFEGEERVLIPSPKVATYDLKPEMSAVEVTDALVERIESSRFGLVVVNYANTDMVGHSGNLAAAIRAVEAVDACLGRLEKAVSARGGVMLITADHGNAEQMRDPGTQEAHTAHTMNRVPLIGVGLPAGMALTDGALADLAPTLLDLMGIDAPAEMTGRSLLVPDRARTAAE